MKTSYQKSSQYYDIIMEKVYCKNPSAFFDFVEFVKNRYCPIEVKSILDVGCGTGVDTIYFAKNGKYQMTGLDISKEMLQVARKKSDDLNLNIEYFNCSISELDASRKYDCIFSYGAFGHILKSDEIEQSLQSLFSALNNNGLLVLHQENILGIAKYVKNREESFNFSDLHFNVKLNYDIDLINCLLMEEENVIISQKDQIIDSFSENHVFRNWIYSEGVRFLENAGFKKVYCFSSIHDREELVGKEISLIYCCIK